MRIEANTTGNLNPVSGTELDRNPRVEIDVQEAVDRVANILDEQPQQAEVRIGRRVYHDIQANTCIALTLFTATLYLTTEFLAYYFSKNDRG